MRVIDYDMVVHLIRKIGLQVNQVFGDDVSIGIFSKGIRFQENIIF